MENEDKGDESCNTGKDGEQGFSLFQLAVIEVLVIKVLDFFKKRPGSVGLSDIVVVIFLDVLVGLIYHF